MLESTTILYAGFAEVYKAGIHMDVLVVEHKSWRKLSGKDLNRTAMCTPTPEKTATTWLRLVLST
jgi:hypothetical protein